MIIENSVRPIIFLDIDDVLAINPNLSGRTVAECFATNCFERDFWQSIFLPAARNNLATLHEAFYPQYVITSSWCNYISLSQFKMIFENTGFNFIAKNFHKNWRTPRLEQTGRVVEIQKWISKHLHSLQPILIIDDNDSGWNLVGCELDRDGLVVLCDTGVGFIDSKLTIATEKLRKQITSGSSKYTFSESS